MKNPKFLILILVLCLPFSSLVQGSDTKALKPKNAKTKIKTIISGKSKTYYPLQFKEPSIISVRGPGKLKVITRVWFVSDEEQQLDYKLYYRIDGTHENEVEFNNVERSETVTYKNYSLGVPGIGNNIILELGLGEHTIELWPGTKTPKVAARYLFTKTREKKINWVSLSPLYPKEPVDLVSRENVIHYFRFSKSKPLIVKINGPTILRILNRMENHYYMKGRINYRLQVKEDGDVKNTYLLSSVRSEITSYKNDGEKIPGKAKEIVINVPGGTHIYEIVPLDKDKKTILGRILFPKKDMKLEE
jgi:hypothetical protein